MTGVVQSTWSVQRQIYDSGAGRGGALSFCEIVGCYRCVGFVWYALGGQVLDGSCCIRDVEADSFT
jgi:hypothetical protein